MKLDKSIMQDYMTNSAGKKALEVKKTIDITKNYINLRNSAELLFFIFFPIAISIELIFFFVSFLIKNK